MAYNELIKNFDRIRDYMRAFYIYGFKSREEYDQKSARSYDDERRRIESWLGDYMGFRQTADGKNVFLSIDSRTSKHNPFYAAWKARSFTDGDITLHFILLDILHSPEVALSLGEIMDKIDGDYLSRFAIPKIFDASTVRKKLKEYTAEGLVTAEKHGKTALYHRAADIPMPDAEALHFFSEVAPCGVIGSFLLDKTESHRNSLAFKHHYITQTPDSGILCALFAAMQEKRTVTLQNLGRHDAAPTFFTVVPLRIFISVQSGRQYLLAYRLDGQKISSFRLDYILHVEPGEVNCDFDLLREKLDKLQNYIWGVAVKRENTPTEHVEFTVQFAPHEEYIYRRLLREKRCGKVERIDERHAKFSADVYDSGELIPWIRTFLCRITEIEFSNPKFARQFHGDIDAMYALYGLKGGDNDAVQ